MKVIGQCMSSMPRRVSKILQDTREIKDTNLAVTQAVEKLKKLLPWTDFAVLAYIGTCYYLPSYQFW